jgi:hypothetical protein
VLLSDRVKVLAFSELLLPLLLELLAFSHESLLLFL